MSEIWEQVSLLKQLDHSLRGVRLTPEQVETLQHRINQTSATLQACKASQQMDNNNNANKSTNTS